MNSLNRAFSDMGVLRASMRRGDDFYTFLASSSLSKPYTEVTREERQSAKEAFFSLLTSDQDWYQDIVNFHEEVLHDRQDEGISTPHIPSQKIKELRIELMVEEFSELLQAYDSGDLVGVADGGTDLIVVILGAMISSGIDLRPIWKEVHKTNMAKKGGLKRADGKLLKPEGWKSPEIGKLLMQQLGVQNE